MTSQIFANVYLNELDRFVRHNIKPLGYVRYGDDFVLFLNSENEAMRARGVADKWLSNQLFLNLHDRNNVVIRPNQGLHFLGHQTYPSGTLVDGTMAAKIVQKIDRTNIGSYQAMYLSKKQFKQLPWLLKAKE